MILEIFMRSTNIFLILRITVYCLSQSFTKYLLTFIVGLILISSLVAISVINFYASWSLVRLFNIRLSVTPTEFVLSVSLYFQCFRNRVNILSYSLLFKNIENMSDFRMLRLLSDNNTRCVFQCYHVWRKDVQIMYLSFHFLPLFSFLLFVNCCTRVNYLCQVPSIIIYSRTW